MKVSNPNKVFKQLGFIGKLYILFYILIMFCGNTFLLEFVPSAMVFEFFLIFCIAKVVKTKYSYWNREYKGLFVILAIFTLFIGWQITIAFDKHITLVYFTRYITYTAFLLVVPKPELTYCTIKYSKYYAFIVSISILLMSIVTGTKAGGLLGDFQAAGMMMSITCMLFMIDYYNETRSIRNIIGFFLALLAIFISGKRAFSVIAIISIAMTYILSKAKMKFIKLISITLLTISISLILFSTFEPVREIIMRFSAFSTNDLYSFTSGRNLLWNMAINIFNNNRIYGIGFGNFYKYTGAYYMNIPGAGLFHTHNIYYGLLSDTGIIGFTLFVCFMVISLIQSIRYLIMTQKNEEKMLNYNMQYSLAIQLWFIIYGFTGNGIYDSNETFFYITATAIYISTRIYLKRAEQVEPTTQGGNMFVNTIIR